MEFSNSVISFLEGYLVGFAVILEEMFPIGFLRHRCRLFAGTCFIFAAKAVEAQEIIGDVLCYGIEIRVIAVNDDDAKLVFLLRCPCSEARERGGDCRYMEGAGLQRGKTVTSIPMSRS